MVGSDMLRRILDWWSFADYDRAKESATHEVVKRFSRGNVSIQNGWYIDEKTLAKLSERGDAAIGTISRLMWRATLHANK